MTGTARCIKARSGGGGRLRARGDVQRGEPGNRGRHCPGTRCRSRSAGCGHRCRPSGVSSMGSNPDRRRRRDRALELPRYPGDVQGRARAARGQHDGAEAVAVHAARDAEVRRARGGHPAARRAERRQRRRCARSLDDGASRHRQGGFDRLDRAQSAAFTSPKQADTGLPRRTPHLRFFSRSPPRRGHRRRAPGRLSRSGRADHNRDPSRRGCASPPRPAPPWSSSH